MKAYTLRLDENTLKALKYMSIEEKKSVRQILLELIRQKIASDVTLRKMLGLEETRKKGVREIMRILEKCSDKDVFQFIREDRER